MTYLTTIGPGPFEKPFVDHVEHLVEPGATILIVVKLLIFPQGLQFAQGRIQRGCLAIPLPCAGPLPGKPPQHHICLVFGAVVRFGLDIFKKIDRHTQGHPSRGLLFRNFGKVFYQVSNSFRPVII